METILDQPESIEIYYNKFRKLPLIIELLPILLGFIGIVFSVEQLVIIGFATAAVLYTALSWYLFKAEKYKIVDVLLAVFFGTGISTAILSIPFQVLNWEYKEEMCITGFLTILLCLALSIIHYGIKYFVIKNKEFEFTMSLKILSRFIALLIIYFIFGMDDSYMALFNN